jgi:hypothetical protein
MVAVLTALLAISGAATAATVTTVMSGLDNPRGLFAGWATGSAAGSGTLCVDAKKSGCYQAIQAALDAAGDGDTIEIGPGTFAGGVTITKSLQLVGAGAGATRIEGGGPVITVGEPDAVDQPTVSIRRVTITGGFNGSRPLPFAALGGGVWIPSGAGNATGATVTISDSVITGNRAAPQTTDPFCGFACAFALGGGIFNAGTLTVTDTRITDNVAGSTAADPSVASSAAGGGIVNGFQGSLTLLQSFVTDNRAGVSPPNGRNTDGGGISSSGTLTVEDSVISGNRSEVEASVPSSFFSDFVQEANAGGLYLTPGSTTIIRSSRIGGNSVHSRNTEGDASAEAGGIDSDGSLLLTDSSVENNTALAIVPASSGFLVEADGGGIQVQGVTTLRNSRVTGNSLSVTSETGTALASGGGLFNLSGGLTLERTVVTANSASATGVGGFNLGGGVTNVTIGGPAPELTLTDSVITANRLAASAGIISQGGGLYTVDPFSGTPFKVTLTRTVIEGNKPDQCVGC